MKVAKLLELLKDYPAEAIVAPKIYSRGMEGMTLEVYSIEPMPEPMPHRLGGIDIPFVTFRLGKETP